MQTIIDLNEKTQHHLLNIAELEKKSFTAVLNDAISEYIESYKETLEILSDKDNYELIKKGKNEIKEGIKGTTLDQLDD